MWPTSIAVWKRSAPPHSGQRSPSLRLAEVGEARLEVAAGLDAAQVPAVAVRAGDELALAQRLVGDDLAREADRAERAAAGAEGGADLVVGRRPRGAARARRRASSRSSRSSPRTSASTSVPSSCRRPASPSRSRRRRSPRNSASSSIVVTPGVSTSSGASSASGNTGGARNAARDLEVGREVAVLAGDERVLARAGRREEVDDSTCRPSSRTRPGRRTPRARSARRSACTRSRLRSKLCVEPVLVAVERVGVLHDELAHAEQAAARARLVAVLDREVVPELRQLLVATGSRARGR